MSKQQRATGVSALVVALLPRAFSNSSSGCPLQLVIGTSICHATSPDAHAATSLTTSPSFLVAHPSELHALRAGNAPKVLPLKFRTVFRPRRTRRDKNTSAAKRETERPPMPFARPIQRRAPDRLVGACPRRSVAVPRCGLAK